MAKKNYWHNLWIIPLAIFWAIVGIPIAIYENYKELWEGRKGER